MLSLIGVAVPVFFLAFLLKYWFAVELARLPGLRAAGLGAGLHPRHRVLRRSTACSPASSTARPTPCTTWCCPSIALATIPFAVIFRITRASVLDVLDEDYVRTAESKGLTIQVIRARHVMRNALLPVITTIGLQTGGLLAGAVLTETVFNFGGIGSTL